MKITDLLFEKGSFTFDEPMKVAFGVLTGYDTLLLKITTDEGISGYGEAAPMGFVTGDSFDTALAVGKDLRKLLIGQDPLAIEQIHARMDGAYRFNTSIKAAIDIACYDIASKRANLPLYRYLGGSSGRIESDVTVGIDTPEHMAEKCRDWIQKGFSQLKIKLGEDIRTDAARIRAVRQAAGDHVTLRADANQGWSVPDAIAISRELAQADIELIEQPIPAWDLFGMGEVRARSLVPVAADESCHLPTDAVNLVRAKAADGVNIKLMKCGGIFNALKIDAIAEAAGLFGMIGCMGESRVSNCAAMHLAAAKRHISKIDLDVTFFANGDAVSGGFTREGGLCTLTEKPGLGVQVSAF